MEISLETAYQVAVAALGESLVRERVLNAQVAQLRGQLQELQPQDDTAEPATASPAPTP